MLTEFHFDEDFLSATDISGPSANIVNTTLLDFWLNKGCLLFPYSFLGKYKEWETTIPAKYSKRWMTAFDSAKQCNFKQNYKPMVEFDSLTEVCKQYSSNDINLILVPNEFVNLGFSDTTEVLQGEEFEISKINGLVTAKCYKRSVELSSSGIEANFDISVVWQERFHKVAKYSKKISIVDRYFSENLIKDLDKNVNKCAIDNFIDFLNSSKIKQKYSITIYTVAGASNSSERTEISNYLRKRMKENTGYKLALSNIRIISCKTEYFKRFSHDRFICFDEFVYEVGRGFEIFRTFDSSATTLSIKNINFSNFNYSIGKLSGGVMWQEDF